MPPRKNASPEIRARLSRERLDALIRGAGLSQPMLARRLGVTQQRVNKILQQPTVSMPVLRRLARATGSTEAYLTGEEDLLSHEVISRLGSEMSQSEMRERFGVGSGARLVLEVKALGSILDRVLPKAERDEVTSMLTRLVLLTPDAWRRFGGARHGWHPQIATNDECGAFAAALVQAARVALQPWVEEKAKLDDVAIRLLPMFWGALLCLNHALRRPGDIEEKQLDHWERLIAKEFTSARALRTKVSSRADFGEVADPAKLEKARRARKKK